MRILLAEDDRGISRAVMRRLEMEGHAADLCETGPDAYDYIKLTEYDMILMDIMLPGEDGLSVVRRCRAEGVKTPILFLTARDSIEDRVTGLDAGGDDYLVKPFALDELMARIRVLARRFAPVSAVTNILTVGALALDTASRTAKRDDREIALTAREYALLEYLMRNKGTVLTRDQIEQKLFSYDYTGASNMVDVYIRSLRKKVDEGREKKLIHTVRYAGYTLREEP